MQRKFFIASSWSARLALCMVAVVGLAAFAAADPITFDPDGPGPDAPIIFSTIDYQPGNGVFSGLGPANAPMNNQLFTYYYQSRVDKFLDAGSNVIPVPGLNQSGGFEITAIFGFSGLANGNGALTAYSLIGGVNDFRLFYDANPLTTANDLAGTGFDDGAQILGGQFTQADGSWSIIPASPLPLFDGFGVDDYAGTRSLESAGGADYTVESLSANSTWFITAPPVLKMHLFNSSNITPFDQVNPSKIFQPNFANYLPLIGATNGLSFDFQVQSDATGSFVVPEPGSFVLLALATAALVSVRRRRVTNGR